jgi:hypothetical protein
LLPIILVATKQALSENFEKAKADLLAKTQQNDALAKEKNELMGNPQHIITLLANNQVLNATLNQKKAENQERGIRPIHYSFVVKPPANVDKTSTTFTQIAKAINEPTNNAARIGNTNISSNIGI